MKPSSITPEILKSIEVIIDTMLDAEDTESLTDWLINKRNENEILHKRLAEIELENRREYEVIKIGDSFYLESKGVTTLRFPEGMDDMIGKKYKRFEIDIWIRDANKPLGMIGTPAYSEATLIKKSVNESI